MGKVDSDNWKAAHAKLRRYAIKSREDLGDWVWWARVPYGTWRMFHSWEDAADWLRYKHGQRVAKNARRDALSRSQSAPNERQA